MTAKDYMLSDRLRDELDKLNVFAFDHPDGFQEVYYYPYDITRKEVEEKIRKDREANQLFDSWLKTMGVSFG